MNIDRRGFLRGLAGVAATAATGTPLVVLARSTVLQPSFPVLYGDGTVDDSVALQAAIDGLPFDVAPNCPAVLVRTANHFSLRGGVYMLSKGLGFRNEGSIYLENVMFTPAKSSDAGIGVYDGGDAATRVWWWDQ